MTIRFNIYLLRAITRSTVNPVVGPLLCLESVMLLNSIYLTCPFEIPLPAFILILLICDYLTCLTCVSLYSILVYAACIGSSFWPWFLDVWSKNVFQFPSYSWCSRYVYLCFLLCLFLCSDIYIFFSFQICCTICISLVMLCTMNAFGQHFNVKMSC